jgi:hypothetical protein
VPHFTLTQVFLLETILVISLLTTHLSQGSVLKSTQIGSLIQYIYLSLYYLCMGRLSIDIFGQRDLDYDWLIYLSLFLSITLIYALVTGLPSAIEKCKKRRLNTDKQIVIEIDNNHYT